MEYLTFSSPFAATRESIVIRYIGQGLSENFSHLGLVSIALIFSIAYLPSCCRCWSEMDSFCIEFMKDIIDMIFNWCKMVILKKREIDIYLHLFSEKRKGKIMILYFR